MQNQWKPHHPQMRHEYMNNLTTFTWKRCLNLEGAHRISPHLPRPHGSPYYPRKHKERRCGAFVHSWPYSWMVLQSDNTAHMQVTRFEPRMFVALTRIRVHSCNLWLLSSIEPRSSHSTPTISTVPPPRYVRSFHVPVVIVYPPVARAAPHIGPLYLTGIVTSPILI